MSWDNRQKRVLFLSKSQVSRPCRHGPETPHNSRGNRHTHERDLVPHVYSLVIKRHAGENSRIDSILTEPFPDPLLILIRRRLALPRPYLSALWNITHVRIVSVLEFSSVFVCVYTQIIVVSGNKQKRPTKLFKVCRGHLPYSLQTELFRSISVSIDRANRPSSHMDPTWGHHRLFSFGPSLK